MKLQGTTTPSRYWELDIWYCVEYQLLTQFYAKLISRTYLVQWFYKKGQYYLDYLTYKKADKKGEMRYARQQIVQTLNQMTNDNGQMTMDK